MPRAGGSSGATAADASSRNCTGVCTGIATERARVSRRKSEYLTFTVTVRPRSGCPSTRTQSVSAIRSSAACTAALSSRSSPKVRSAPMDLR